MRRSGLRYTARSTSPTSTLMDERLLARLLFSFGLGSLGLVAFFGSGWAAGGALERAAFATALVAAVVGLLLDVKHRRQDKKRQRATGGGPM